MDRHGHLSSRVPSPPIIKRGARCSWRTRWFTIILSMLFLCLPVAFAADEARPKADPARIEAAFLRNFARYVTWPSHTFADAEAPWRICILGGDPFGDVLEETLHGRMEQGRPFTVLRANIPAEIRHCHVVFVAHRSSESRRAVLAELANKPVLTVSNAPAFLEEGGTIQFQISDRVAFSVNLDQANSASLKIPTKVLEVASEIVENGVVRRRR